MKKITLICIPVFLVACNHSSKDSSASSSDSSKSLETSVSQVANNDMVPTLTVKSLDSLNYIFTSQPDVIKSKYLNKIVRFTGSITKDNFILSTKALNGRSIQSEHGVTTDLNTASFVNIIQNQPNVVIYDKLLKKCFDINEEIRTNGYTPYEVLLSIYSTSAASSMTRDSYKSQGSSEAETNQLLQKDGIEAYNNLKSFFPALYKDLTNGNIVIVNDYTGEAKIMDFVTVDEVTIEGKVLDIGENGLDKLGIKLMNTKIVRTKRILDLDKMTPFVPNFK